MSSFPYNLYRGLSVPVPNSPIDRRDLLNYTGDNTIQTSRYINPVTQDFEVSSTNHLQGMNAVEQAVMLAINTTFNSSVQTSFGQNFRSMRLMPTNIAAIQSQATSIVQQALSFLINSNQISLTSVQVNNNGNGQLAVQFTYNNNTLGTTVQQQFTL